LNIVPSPAADSTSTLPPYNYPNFLTIPNPNPVPDVGFVEKDGSKISGQNLPIYWRQNNMFIRLVSFDIDLTGRVVMFFLQAVLYGIEGMKSKSQKQGFLEVNLTT